MNTAIALRSSGPHTLATVTTVATVLFAGALLCSGQQPTPASKHPAATATGYLGKAAPSGLRFAPPPKPPVAYLPPLPITYDPQPVFTPEFANPTGELPPPPPPPNNSSNLAPPSVPGPEKVLSPLYPNHTPGGKQNQVPLSAGEIGVVIPQMLVKFFQPGQPTEVQMLMNNPVMFQPPLRQERPSSSATYQVK